MYTHYQPNQLTIEWTIYRGVSKTKEDFGRSELAAFVFNKRYRAFVACEQSEGVLTLHIPADLPAGTYSLHAIWTKNKERSIQRATAEQVFAVSEYAGDATYHGGAPTEDPLKVMSSAGTYGYDGLSAYELAVLYGKTTKSEEEWVQSAVDTAEAEDKRCRNETFRQQAEQSRQQAETERDSAEQLRATTFEQLEEDMQTAIDTNLKSIEQTTTSEESSGVNIITATLHNGNTQTFQIRNGSRGQQGIAGPQGPQGPQGNSGYTGAAEELELVNNLSDGGATAALSAEMGKTIKKALDTAFDTQTQTEWVVNRDFSSYTQTTSPYRFAFGLHNTQELYATSIKYRLAADVTVCNLVLVTSEIDIDSLTESTVDIPLTIYANIPLTGKTATLEGQYHEQAINVTIRPNTYAFLDIDAQALYMKAGNLYHAVAIQSPSAPVPSSGTAYGKVTISNAYKVYLGFDIEVSERRLILKESALPTADTISADSRSVLQGKKIMAVGDSMVYGHSLRPYTWTERIDERCGSVSDNRGTNGAFMSLIANDTNNRNPYSVYSKVCDPSSSYYISDADLLAQDYFIIYAGTNDASQTIGDATSTDPHEICGALNLILTTLQSRAPKLHIGLITPNYRSWITNYVNDVVPALINVCKNYRVPVFNQLEKGINTLSESVRAALCLNDSIPHLNADGLLWISYRYEAFIKSL